MRKFFFYPLLVSCLIIAGCAARVKPVDTGSLSDLENLTQGQLLSHQILTSKIRVQALKDTAMTIGAQSGLYYRAQQLNEMMKSDAKHLSAVFDFQHLLLDDNVLPPVIQKNDGSVRLNSPDTISIADKTYQISKQARFVTAPPNWRDYLMMNYEKPPVPDQTLLPRNKNERKIWKEYIRIGWKNGVKQADNIYTDNLARLKTDYNGMVFYRELLAQNMVTKPYVATANLGITGNAQRTKMRVNDRVLRISAVPKLNPNSASWKPAMTTTKD